jgi:Mn-dependent DtxR family transcriptional regulator
MLGGHRPTVSIAAGMLQQAGLIEYRRGQITILNRKGWKPQPAIAIGSLLQNTNVF